MTTTETMTNVRMRRSGREAVRTVEGTLDNLATTIRGQARRPRRADAGTNDTIDASTLTAFVGVVEAAEAATAEAVAYLREQGYSWSEIAAGLGVSKQAAAKRYGGDTETVTFRRVGGAS